MSDDPYEVLGVTPGTDLPEVRRAYLAELRRSHPDVRPGDTGAEQRTRDLNRAWEQIRRRQHRAARATPPPRRVKQPAYSADRHHYRIAFTRTSLRVALAVVAFSFVLLAMLVR